MIALLLLLAEGPVTTSTATIEQYKSSLDPADADQSWREPGLRVAIGYAYERMIGIGGVPSGELHSAVLRLGPRLDERWLLLGSFRYASIGGQATGLRFSGTIEPTLEVFDHFTLALGLGVGGFVIGHTGAPTPTPDIVATYTLPGTRPLIGACSGAGLIGVLRAEYSWVLSDLFALGPALELNGQWTPCTQELGRSDPDTGAAIDLKQYWQTVGLNLGWQLWWR